MPRSRQCLFVGLLLVPAVALMGWAGAPPAVTPGMPPRGPLSPHEEKATFRLAPGFRIDLVASEPDVVDPVAMAFDEDGRLYVAEMRGYPNEGVGTGEVASGRIKLLEDADGDGVYEKAHLYAEGLRLPNSVMPWRGGLLVSNAPDLIYLRDTDGDGRADERKVLYTGFGLSNIQQMLNALQWGMDNWVHGVAGSSGGTVTSPEKPDMPAITLQGRGVRFRPDVPGSLEPTSGGGQFGLAPGRWQHWLTATNSQHLKQIVLPDHYLRRNPLLPVRAVAINIPDHGAACKVHRLSPFEAWRVERTRRRAESATASRFSSTELVPGGFITSACSPIVTDDDLFPEAYRGNVLVCDPANNLVHRDLLEQAGVVFVARRADADCEFLASTDNWFRPVYLDVGPDGAVYLLDFYREAIETPLSLPEDIKKQLNLQSRARGRIWRIAPEKGARRSPPALSRLPSAKLVAYLDRPGKWWRLTAQRLLVERGDRAAVAPLTALAGKASLPEGRAHALWTLDALGALPEALLVRALRDTEPGVREHALRLCDSRLSQSAALRQAVVALAEDPSARVRFQLAFTLGEAKDPALAAALAGLAWRDADDGWIQTAVLSSAYRSEAAMLQALARDRGVLARASAGQRQLLQRLAELTGTQARDEDLVRLLALLGGKEDRAEAWQLALLEGLGQGLANSKRFGSAGRLWDSPPAGLADSVVRARSLFQQAGTTARDTSRPLAERLTALKLLGHGPFATLREAAGEALQPQAPPALLQAAVEALARQTQPEAAGLLLSAWTSYGPTARREVLEALFARRDRLLALLEAMEKKQVQPTQLEPARLDQLRRHPDAQIRKRAVAALAGLVTEDRRKVVEGHRPALELRGEVERGRQVFRKVCVTCHRLENVGHEVGPELPAVLTNKTPEQLLQDILDPSREVDPRYLNYVVNTSQGRTLTGLIAAETASSVTLRRGDQAEDVILRTQIEEIQTTAKSLMPEGLEMQLKPQDLADVITYLQAMKKPR